MTNVLIRGLSNSAVDRIDAASAALGLSRNEYLRRMLEGTPSLQEDATLTPDDWRRSAETFADLSDPSVMDAAWR